MKHLVKLRIDGNQISVIIDNLFAAQTNLEFLGKFLEIYFIIRKKTYLHTTFGTCLKALMYGRQYRKITVQS